MLLMAIPVTSHAATAFPLTNFDIKQYSDAAHSYTTDNGTIYKSKAPLAFEAIQAGNGGIDGSLFMDGVQLSKSDYTDNLFVYKRNFDGDVTQWGHLIVFKPYVLKELSNGKHTVKAICWGHNVGGPIPDTFTFNLVE